MNEHLAERFARQRRFQPQSKASYDPNNSKEQLNRGIRTYVAAASAPPANNAKPWLCKAEVPTTEEILDDEEEPLQLPENRLDKPWPNRRRYLETHYELLREDAISPLRDAVAQFKSNPSMDDDDQVAVYEKASCSDATQPTTNTNLGLYRRFHVCTPRASCETSILYRSGAQKHRVGVLEALDFWVSGSPHTIKGQFPEKMCHCGSGCPTARQCKGNAILG